MNFCITGAFGYSGSYLSRIILGEGHNVKTLTNNPALGHPLKKSIQSLKFEFNHPDKMVDFIKGSDTFINNYWVRFNHKKFNHHEAVENSFMLIDSARKAGVERFIQISITNPSLESNLEYFKGKAEIEEYLINSGLSYCILRPTVLFGREDVLINNISWFIRNFPAMGVFGDGSYKIQPVYVEDLARLSFEKSFDTENEILNAVGAETYTYKELIRLIMKTINQEKPIVNLNPTIGFYLGWIVSFLKKDVTITKPEIEGLMSGLLAVDTEPPCPTSFSEWIMENKETLGKKYVNELNKRNY
jgi:nucleoside-diphosphate-sugar epimerase